MPNKKAGISGLFYLVMLPVFRWQLVVAVVFWRLAFAIMLRAFIVVRRLAFAIVLWTFVVAWRLAIMLLFYRRLFRRLLMVGGESG